MIFTCLLHAINRTVTEVVGVPASHDSLILENQRLALEAMRPYYVLCHPNEHTVGAFI
jgi:hypothetical protein